MSSLNSLSLSLRLCKMRTVTPFQTHFQHCTQAREEGEHCHHKCGGLSKTAPKTKKQTKQNKNLPTGHPTGSPSALFDNQKRIFLFLSHVHFFFHTLHSYDPTRILKEPMSSIIKTKLLQIALSPSPSEVGPVSRLCTVLKPCRMNGKLKTCNQQ